ASAQRGAVTLPRNLTQLTTQAALIVHGRVLYSHVEPHPQYRNLSSVVVTIGVFDVLKGTAGKSLSFRQFIWDPRDIADRGGYHNGDELFLFLNKVTAAGFTSPVGLEQGRLRLVRGLGGEASVAPAVANSLLYQGLDKFKG